MMGLDELTRRLQIAVRQAGGVGRTLKFDLAGEGIIRIDGDTVDNSDLPTECTLQISRQDLCGILAGQIDAVTASRDGRLEVIGDPGAAISLQALIMNAWLPPQS